MDFVSLITEQWKDQPFSISNYFLHTAIFLAHWPPMQARSTALLGFAMLRYVIGSKLSRHFFIQLEIKPNSVATVRVFPRFTHVTVCTVCDFTMGGWTQLGERVTTHFFREEVLKIIRWQILKKHKANFLVSFPSRRHLNNHLPWRPMMVSKWRNDWTLVNESFAWVMDSFRPRSSQPYRIGLTRLGCPGTRWSINLWGQWTSETVVL